MGDRRRTAAQSLGSYEMRTGGGDTEAAGAAEDRLERVEREALLGGASASATASSVPRRQRRPQSKSNDPLGCLCRLACPRLERLGHNYVLVRTAKGPLLTAGPHWAGTIFAQGMILAVVYAFTKDGTPMGRHPIFGAVFHWFGAMCTVLLWLTALSNPGIVVRGGPGTVDPEAVDADDIYCDICDIWVGPRTHHCRDCGVCIEKHDHHCVWMGKCIGKGNMKAFVWFNTSWVCAFIYMFACLALLPGPHKKVH
mmetsp:Transcript_10407/g.31197  ORF Transcript_10407/g.31197 Transcript_10407/m.31197 type:complete len:254 (-) Transcript_10407:135-896(-)